MLAEAVVLPGRAGEPHVVSAESEDVDASVMDKIDNCDEDSGDPSALASEKIIVATPQETMPGESQSKGLAERAVQQVEDQVRAFERCV